MAGACACNGPATSTTIRANQQTGYRFIWRRPDGSLQPARGQARLPSLADAELLMRLARDLGWGDRHADDALGQVQ